MLGHFASPGFPSSYHSSAECLWTITAPDGYQVKLTVKWFGINQQGQIGNCGYDILQVNDEVRGRSRMMGMFCGCESVPALVSNGNKLWVKFVSDANGHWPGFLANFKAISKLKYLLTVFKKADDVIES